MTRILSTPGSDSESLTASPRPALSAAIWLVLAVTKALTSQASCYASSSGRLDGCHVSEVLAREVSPKMP